MNARSVVNTPDVADGGVSLTTGQPDRIALRRLGFWSALATALLGFGYGLAVIIMVASSLSSGEAATGWQGIEAYRAAFRPGLLLPLIPSLLLAPAFAALMVCVHSYAAPTKRIWSQAALVYTVIYAGMAFTNYATQLLSVQRALIQGETDGLSMWVHGNPHAIFWSLVSAYVFMNLAMLFAVPVFHGGRLERWIRRLFLLNGLSAIITIACILVDNPTMFMLGSLVIWCPLFTAAAALLVVLFGRLDVRAER
jgi:hypothetical protein